MSEHRSEAEERSSSKQTEPTGSGPEDRASDALAERAGRWTAARFTRRSLFGRVGRAAVMLAGGPAIATLLADPASARVCGQSGVSPKCSTYDCADGQWGYCWYSVGCCADGALKKICDCCVAGYPNVHGYCPPGANVKCIVESCGNDPRVQSVAVTRLPGGDPTATATAVRAVRFPRGSGVVVLADAGSNLATAVAMPVGAVVAGPVLVVARNDLGPDTAAVIEATGATAVKIVDAWLPATVDDDLRARGYDVERIGAAGDIETFSLEVARWIRGAIGSDRAVCITAEGQSSAAAPVAAAFAAGRGCPLLVGVEAATATHDDAAANGLAVVTYMIGPEAAARAGEVPGSRSVSGPSLPAIAAALATVARTTEQARTDVIALASRAAPGLLALAELRVPLVLHEPTAVDGAREWLFADHRSLRTVYVLDGPGALSTPAYYELQSILNGYEAHRLIGVAGQGLPVVPQPRAEQPIGLARVGPTPPR
ncbi:MAG: hypothetical protein E6G17_01460 [Actinobacteria bacterium]|nr:MAG: hypothetical protein E6G17_01460 [Actinomycetota bacterium]